MDSCQLSITKTVSWSPPPLAQTDSYQLSLAQTVSLSPPQTASWPLPLLTQTVLSALEVTISAHSKTDVYLLLEQIPYVLKTPLITVLLTDVTPPMSTARPGVISINILKDAKLAALIAQAATDRTTAVRVGNLTKQTTKVYASLRK